MIINRLAQYAALALTIFLSMTDGVFAHVQHGEAMGFMSGIHHPMSGLDHVAAMIAVGLWSVQLGRPALWLLPIIFPLVMALGGVFGLMGVPMPAVETGIALSGIVLGAAVLFQQKMALPFALALVSFFAVFHGYAHGAELPAGQSGWLYSLGFILCTASIHGLGIMMGLVHRWSWGATLVRSGGLAVLLAGVYFLSEAIA